MHKVFKKNCKWENIQETYHPVLEKKHRKKLGNAKEMF